MGAHISSVPNHITHRSIPLKWRALVAMSGNFGVEADITKWSKKDQKDLAGYIQTYKEIRPLIQFGDFYRLESPYNSPRASWMFVNKAQTEALLFVFQVKPTKKGERAKGIKLKGLKPSKIHKVQGEGLKISGKTLMEGWLPKSFKNSKGSYHCALYRINVL
jgi:alpha-galactosidase